jgi:hypothetical protein
MQGYRAILLSRFGVYPKNDRKGFSGAAVFWPLFFWRKFFSFWFCSQKGVHFSGMKIWARYFLRKWIGYLIWLMLCQGGRQGYGIRLEAPQVGVLLGITACLWNEWYGFV